MTNPLRIVFAGTPGFSVPPLRALLNSSHEVVAVYTQPDRPSGRGRKLTPSPVKQLAQEHNVTVCQPLNFKDQKALEQLRQMAPDLMIVVAYGLILPQQVLDIPKYGCINIHASLLPRWRGAAPIQRAIAGGDAETGITIMQMEAGLDTGPVWLSRVVEIGADENTAELHDRLSHLGADALMEALPDIVAGERMPVVQAADTVTYAKKLSKEEAHIDWSLPAEQINRQIRAFNPWPVAFALYGDQSLRIWDATALSTSSVAAPGTVVASQKDGIDIATGSGLLRITRLQIPGKRAMDAGDFVNAHHLDGVMLE